MSLKVRLHQSGRPIKEWHLTPGCYIIGSSTNADLVVPSLKTFEYVLEFDTCWRISNLSEDGQTPSKLQGSFEFDDCYEIENGCIKLNFALNPEKRPLFTDATDTSVKNPSQLCWSIELNGHTIETIVSNGKETHYVVDGEKFKLDPEKIVEVGPYSIRPHRIAYKREKLDWNSPVDNDQLKILAGSILTASLLILCSWMFKTQHIDEAEAFTISLPRPQIKKPAPKQPKTKAVAKNLSNKPSGKKSPSSSRLSKLMGKIAKRSARNSVKVKRRGISAANTQTKSTTASLVRGKGLSTISDNFKGVQTKGLAGGGNLDGFAHVRNSAIGTAGIRTLDEETEIIGGLDREVIAKFIRERLGQILYCYERQLSAKPDLYGKVHINFEIQASGNVRGQLVKESTLKDKYVEDCMLKKISNWTFPKPKGGTRVVVTYPFLFNSTN